MWTPVYFSARAGRVDGCQDAVLSSQQDGQRAESGGEGGPDQRRGERRGQMWEERNLHGRVKRMREGHWKMDQRGCEREKETLIFMKKCENECWGFSELRWKTRTAGYAQRLELQTEEWTGAFRGAEMQTLDFLQLSNKVQKKVQWNTFVKLRTREDCRGQSFKMRNLFLLICTVEFERSFSSSDSVLTCLLEKKPFRNPTDAKRTVQIPL